MHCLALYNARTVEEHSKDEHSSYYRNPESTAALCLPPSTTTAETAAPAPARAQALAAAAVAVEAASPAQGGAAATAKTLLTAEDAADHDQGPPVQWEEHRKLSVEVSVRAIADMLLEAGADVDAIDGEGNTPLLTAAETGGVALCELLLARGANADARWVHGIDTTGTIVFTRYTNNGCNGVKSPFNCGFHANKSCNGVKALVMELRSSYFQDKHSVVFTRWWVVAHMWVSN